MKEHAGRVGKWRDSTGRRGRYLCQICDRAFDVKEAPKKLRLVHHGKGYVRVGPAKFIYLTKGIEINVPAIVLTGLTAGAIMGAVYAILNRWQLTQKAKIIEDYLMGKR